MPTRYAAVVVELRRDHHCLYISQPCLATDKGRWIRRGPLQPLDLQRRRNRMFRVRDSFPSTSDRSTQSTSVGHGGLHSNFLAGPSSNGDPNAKSRRRRRGADAESQPKNQSFYFVDSTSSSKEKRAHVMRHHVQEKRKHRKLSHGSLQPEQAPEPTVWPVRTDSGYDTDNPKEAAMAGVPGPAIEQESSV